MNQLCIQVDLLMKSISSWTNCSVISGVYCTLHIRPGSSASLFTNLLSDPLPFLHGDLVPPEAVLVVRGERVDDDGDGQRHDEHAEEGAEPASHLIDWSISHRMLYSRNLL